MPDDSPDFDAPVALFEDVEDLKAAYAQLDAQVKTLTDAAGHEADGAGEESEFDAETGEDDEAAEGEW
ncbi:hypothetical protein ACWCPJ_37140 [Streptomyces collinus]